MFSAYRIGSYRHMLNTMLETLKHFVYGQGQTCWDVLRLWGSHHIPSGDTMIHQVRESQTNSLYDRDWNRPQFGAPRELGWGQALSKCWIHVRVSYPTGDEKPKIDVIFIESVKKMSYLCNPKTWIIKSNIPKRLLVESCWLPGFPWPRISQVWRQHQIDGTQERHLDRQPCFTSGASLQPIHPPNKPK